MTDSLNLADDARIARAEGLVASEVDDEVVILNIKSGHFFQLNPIGSRIWELLDAPMTLTAICTSMRDRFEVDAEQCRSDVTEFVQKMRDQGLVERV